MDRRVTFRAAVTAELHHPDGLLHRIPALPDDHQHTEAFEALGGVPRTILYDTLKSVVLERHGDVIRFHPRILEFAGHCHFAAKPVGIARGNEKGACRAKDSRPA